MIDATTFAEGLTRIGIAVRQPADAATLRVYFDALADDTDAEEWPQFCRWAVRASAFAWFPKVAELLDALRRFRGEQPVGAEGTAAYDRVLASGTYSPQGGTSWTFRGVLESCGRAAAEAFQEAGAHHAFATTWDEAKRRERFVAAYVEAVRAGPSSRLLPAASERKALPSGEGLPSSAAEVRGILRELADRARAAEPEPARKRA